MVADLYWGIKAGRTDGDSEGNSLIGNKVKEAVKIKTLIPQ